MSRLSPPAAPAVFAAFVLSGLALAAYPVVRPYGPESGAAGADTFASPAWLVAHLLAVVGFVALAFGLRAAAHTRPEAWRWSGRPVREAETRMWLAVALLLPYYGAEAYGLGALGRHAVESGDPSVLAVADGFRYASVEITTFGTGLLLLVLVGARLGYGLWASGTLGRTGGLLAGLGLATFLPQFYGTPELRMLHGVVLGLGLVLVGVTAARRAPVSSAGAPRAHASASVPS
ncbi:hypothetical protein [Nocardioides donggukensis]|uniref:DUF4386 family protein n=1 Tax=Nocardioides donggukensis TaxID=2774019 RepID=A0A927K2B3_9ACTN|nr:hypothetical protein [Nocardioides donggukensis]MBD8868462.1 hypothetical protein [Nocardioides donggukensis]